jgi:hypothetical protein
MCPFDRTHVLAPTAVDLAKYGQEDGTILSAVHADISFLTIHGRSHFPSLHIWPTNTDRPIRVEIPPRSDFLVQAGRQLEDFTVSRGHGDGPIKAGRHEVVVNDQTLEVSDSDANIFSCTHLAILIRLLNDGGRNFQIDLRLLSESHQPFFGTFQGGIRRPI